MSKETMRIAKLLIAVVLPAVLVVGLAGCAAPLATPPLSVKAGAVYPSSYLNVTAPKSAGWRLIQSSQAGMAFARSGNAPGESFVASVVIFDLPQQTNKPEEFEALIVDQAGRDLETKRFTTKQFSHHYSSVRGYPCVEVHNVSEDREARIGPGKTETLLLENENLYCRHPTRSSTGFVVIFSHRGSALYSNFDAEARSFIEGVQVPAHPSTAAQ